MDCDGDAQAMRRPALALWGGIEPTHNRVRDGYFSQLDRSGHRERIDDLTACAKLGLRTLRYPVLWEQVMPGAATDANWRWPDERLARLRELEITPIVGLVHHGSGPAHTSLMDDDFARKLAEYAAHVAQRYPWVSHYTPVNEPLTTALFSGLYGVWYPHARSNRAFVKALLAQCRGVVLAMRAIRNVNPDAKLVQTDDLGKTYSTAKLDYQATFNNHRRWLAWDLLCGRVDSHHPLWSWLLHYGGATPAQLLWFADHRCAPDIVGVNHYVTSERYLSERLDDYPACYHGGNARHRYADVEAVRCRVERGGLRMLLGEAWSRYGLPIAVTEAHIDATREDQLRWFAGAWNAARELREAGADIRAVTMWALFGAFDWNCLVTRAEGYYESGAFDVRESPPRPTALAALAQSLATGNEPDHPLLADPGWWHRPGRYIAPRDLRAPKSEERASAGAPILILGANGTLGRAFARICAERGIACRTVLRSELDMADAASVRSALARYEPWVVINAAGYVRVDDAEGEAAACFRDNAEGPENLAVACAQQGIALLTFSSDLVFDGAGSTPYVESDAPAPINVYGRSKLQAEQRVLARCPDALVIRTSAFFGPWDEHNFVTLALRTMRSRQAFHAANDMVVTPTYVPDLVNVSLDLLIDRCTGLWHLSNGEPVSWADLAIRAASVSGVRADSLVSCPSATLNLRARRPLYSALASTRCSMMPSLDDALVRYASAHPAEERRRLTLSPNVTTFAAA